MARIRKAAAILVPLALSASLVAFAGPAESKLPQESPIDVVHPRLDTHAAKLNISYGRSDLDLHYDQKDAAEPNGCNVRHHEESEKAEVKSGNPHIRLGSDATDWKLLQFHFHTPSEHKFAGHSYPLELHLVHENVSTKQLAVIGVPLKVGAASTVDTVLAKLAPECGDNVHLSQIDLNTLLPHDKSTLRYMGSLTTFPYSEGVRWFLMGEKTVTQATITRFQQMFPHGNSREVQPLNGRVVTAVPHI
ncbi:carbonic anhydrase family protein [Kibdelosporangium philippinense]|uniref:carbonic anhydrase n=1 Tax=Kibdelosporangium philippinense TaxID=211113 RepID=A0ABS8ZTT4_9PSEU|nr:carbonic anhydrase family protein [Kibdelosporangium philippinense]MCE7011145.1 carbonic anhydrase family protein [Kibdelosporangium philippinense]